MTIIEQPEQRYAIKLNGNIIQNTFNSKVAADLEAQRLKQQLNESDSVVVVPVSDTGMEILFG